ncbi:MAG: MerR family transcriptional regulator [Chloroflexota bacterium]
MLTIGELAKQVGLRTSALRYYEKEKLIKPASRSESGYRQYTQEAITRVQMIQRAQRLGFSLADIRQLLTGWDTGDLSDQALIQTAETRYHALEKKVTEIMVLQHELGLFMQDLQSDQPSSVNRDISSFERLLERVCANPTIQFSTSFTMDLLMNTAGCNLTSAPGKKIIDRLRGQHTHVWKENDKYYSLFVSTDPQVGAALEELAQLEADCEAHEKLVPEFSTEEEGYLFVAGGENGFIFARLFMALESEERTPIS